MSGLKVIRSRAFADSGSKKIRRLKITRPNLYHMCKSDFVAGTTWFTDHIFTVAEIENFFGEKVKDGTYIKSDHAACAELSDARSSLITIALEDLRATYTGWSMQVDRTIREALQQGKRL